MEPSMSESQHDAGSSAFDPDIRWIQCIWSGYYLAVRSYVSIQSSVTTITAEQAWNMLTTVAKSSGGFEHSGEYYEACRAFHAGPNFSMPNK